MNQAGARGPGSLAKPAPPLAAKPATPTAPGVAPKGVVVPKAAAPAAPTRVGKTTMLGVQAPKGPVPVAPSPPVAPSAPVAPFSPIARSGPAALPSSAQGADDTWNEEKTRVEERGHDVPVPSPAPPTAVAVAPAAPPARPVAAPAPSASWAALTAADVRLIVSTVLEEALLPLQRTLLESQQRIADLERRPVPTTLAVLAETTRGYAAAAAAPVPYVSAVAAPVRTVVATPYAPLLDVKAIERDMPNDFNNPFDGRRRRRRLGAFVIVMLLAVFGGLFALLAESYTPHH
jgi:hypothetical protein